MSTPQPTERMKMTRRQLLSAAASMAVVSVSSTLFSCGSDNAAVTPPAPAAPFVETFPQPEVRASTAGLLDTSLTAQYGVNAVGTRNVTTRTYQGLLAGPTLKVKPGDTLRLNLINQLPPNPDENTVFPDLNTPHHFNSTNNHTHGLHVSPQNNSDNIFVEIPPGQSFQYEYFIPGDHPAGTFWYHPHKHGSTSVQLFGGMAGALIVQGGLDLVPELLNVRDLVFLIGELNIDPTTLQVPDFNSPPPGSPQPFNLANRILIVNGQLQPTINARPGEVIRLRVLNATVRTFVPFAVDGHTLNVAAIDGITLPALRPVNGSVDLAAANRADILIQCGAPGTYGIRKLVDTQEPNPGGGQSNPAALLASLVVAGDPVNMPLPTTLPVNANLPDISINEVTNNRTLTFAVGPGGPPGFPNFTIDGNRFDPNRVDHTVPLNAVEEWLLVNTSNTGHPFHIHINPFQVIEINGVPLPQPEWRDTVQIPAQTQAGPGTVRIRHRFQDFTGLFVLHCHILIHEDLGMMQVVNVV